MTAQDAGGAGQDIWLDMSRYPDTDPDTALTGAEQDLLRGSLAVDDSELPDAVWEHMLAVVTGADETADADPGADGGTDPAADDAPADWSADPPSDVDDDDPSHDPADEGTWDDTWDGGAV